MSEEQKEILENEGLARPGEELVGGEGQRPIDPKEIVSQEEIAQLKQQHPRSKFAFFYHVDDLYLYRSYTTGDLEVLSNKRKVAETEKGTAITDDEYLVMFLNEFVRKPAKCGDKHAAKELSAGIPHLLYDLINHLSGFAEVAGKIVSHYLAGRTAKNKNDIHREEPF